MTTRHDGRTPQQIRPIAIERQFTRVAPGSVLYRSGATSVLCTASIDNDVPPWMADQNRGWMTAEYNMLPSSTSPRKRRDRSGKVDGRTTEIQRLIGRSLRAVLDADALGARQITVDCDVLEADGGTRTASISGALVAVVDALQSLTGEDAPTQFPLRDSVAAISVGVVNGVPVADLDYVEDSAATVDMNVVLTGSGEFIEIQGTGEGATFDEEQLTQLLRLARGGIADVTAAQRKILGSSWPF